MESHNLNMYSPLSKYMKAAHLATLTALTIGTAMPQQLTIYADSRGGGNANISAATKLPKKVQASAWIDIFTDNFKPQRAYGELYVTRELWKGIGIDLENDLSIANATTNVQRAGIQYKHRCSPITLRYSPLSTRGQGQQLTAFGGGAVKGFGYGGFIDWDMNNKKIVTEWEATRKLRGKLSAVVEARYNQYQKRSAGIAAGLRYALR
jgi:hypothetical protein